MYMLQLFDLGDGARPIDARLLDEGVLRIGRDAGADWPIADPLRQVSRLHCEVEASEAGLSLRSLGANGVFDADTGDQLPRDEAVALPLPCAFTLGGFRIAASRAPDGGASTQAPAPAPVARGSLLEAFCDGAGIDASLLSAEDPGEIMRRAGAVYRETVLGLADLIAERERMRTSYQLASTMIAGAGNNPFKWAPTQKLPVDLLLSGAHHFLSGPGALKASFEDLRRHLAATVAGMRAALRHVADRFEPGAVEAAVAARASLFKQRGALHGEELAARHAALALELDMAADGAVGAAFAAGYAEADRAYGRAG